MVPGRWFGGDHLAGWGSGVIDNLALVTLAIGSACSQGAIRTATTIVRSPGFRFEVASSDDATSRAWSQPSRAGHWHPGVAAAVVALAAVSLRVIERERIRGRGTRRWCGTSA